MKPRKIAFFLFLAILSAQSNLWAESDKAANKSTLKTKPKGATAPTPEAPKPAEEVPPKVEMKIDQPERIDLLSKYLLTWQVVFGTPGFSLELENLNQTSKVSFAPNLSETVGLSINFRDYFGVTGSLHGAPKADSAQRGHTDYDDFHFDFDFKNFLVETQYQRYNGLYVSNTPAIDSTYVGNLLEPNMSMQNILLAFTYVFKPKNYSIQAALSRTERQIHSGGSWLAGIAATQTTIENSSGLIPSQVRNYFGVDQNITKDRSRTLMGTGGYAYTISFTEKFFTSLLGVVGYGLGDSSYTVSNVTSSLNFGAFTFSAKLVIAYNGDSFITGVSSESQVTNYQTQSIKINSDPMLSQLFFGTRY